MQNPPINWSEGTFLRPHHFQAAERSLVESAALSQQLDHGYGYGIRSIRISEQALENSQLAVSNCRARMKDGTLISIDENHEVRLDLAAALTAGSNGEEDSALDEQTLRVYLAQPQAKSGAPNVGPETDPGSRRYYHFSRSVEDEVTGGNPQELDFRAANIQLLLSSDDLAGYEILPICQVKRSADNGSFRLDKDYIPPCLAVDAWAPLDFEIVRAIYDIVGARATSLSEQIVDRNIQFSSREAGDLEKLLLLHVLNEAIGTLTCLGFAKGVHPLNAYRALCELVGRLSTFADARKVAEIPLYDHDDLARIFRWAMRQIDLLLNASGDEQYEQRFFIGAGKGMQVAMEAKWFDPGWTWYVGVHAVNIPKDVCLQLLTKGKIDWKLGSSDQVDFLYAKRAEGVELVPLPQVPRALPTDDHWLYFEISKENQAWKHVQATKNLAIRMNQKIIRNHDKLEGQRRLLATVNDKLVGLEFAIFAVAARG